jgi:hypothetical protein
MNLEKFEKEEVKIETSEMSKLKGGTSTTEYTQVGAAEDEWELDEDGERTGYHFLIDMPI